MLVFSLRIKGHELLNPIFVSLCGLCQANANVYKSMKGKKEIYKLTIEDIHKSSGKEENGDKESQTKKKTLLVTDKQLRMESN